MFNFVAHIGDKSIRIRLLQIKVTRLPTILKSAECQWVFSGI